ncbi:MAG: SRPBCC domain-containing protein [Gemmatimonadota bacterium]
MNFSFSGAAETRAPIATVWDRLTDPMIVGASGPGVQRVVVQDPNHFQVITGIKLGSFKVDFTMHVELHDLVPQQEFKMRARGKATASAIRVDSRVHLEPLPNGHTGLSWNATTEISGILARIAGKRLEALARDLTERFWLRFVAATEAAA